MTPDKQITKVEGRNITLSNLDKVLFEDAGFTKAQLIEYYIRVKEYILPFIADRPMTFIRYPDGTKSNHFYSKNRAEWTPEWIASVKVGDDDVDYVLINHLPDLVWAANMAALELHPMTVKSSDLEHPDLFIIDLDPPTEADFAQVKVLAKELKIFFEQMDLTTFLKTSGSKGLHLFVPITPKYTHEEIVQFLKTQITLYIQNQPDATLAFKKDKRKGKILIDLFRNNKNQTCAAAFGTRGRPSGAVSLPIHWEDLDDLTTSQAYDIHTTVEYLTAKGNAWEAFYDFSTDLPGARTDQATLTKAQVKKNEKLEVYREKRDFSKTTEPAGTTLSAAASKEKSSPKFTIQLHDASRLHFDLRLEHEGVLQSWAVPKGLPTTVNEKRLAIRTEDHPLQYLTFEGTIPEKQYGAGEMWIFDTGTYQTTKHTTKSIHFQLKGSQITGDFHIFQTKDDQWLIERISPNKVELPTSFDPMLADLSDGKIPPSSDYFFEIKWDGIRINLVKNHDEITITSRGGRDISSQFPEVIAAAKEIKAEQVSLDGELVVLDGQGKPVFAKIISRLHQKKVGATSKSNQCTAYFFDLLYLDGLITKDMPVERRRAWVKAVLPVGEILRFSEAFEDGNTLWEAVKAHGLEGVICKSKASKYVANRSKSWLKVKVRSDERVFIVGYTPGQGERSPHFGSLHLAQMESGEILRYVGRVGTGFDQKTMIDLYDKINELPKIAKPFEEKIEEEQKSVWVAPVLECKVKYASLTPGGIFREPVFLGLIVEDKTI
ncbi:MAG TPA: non-homologous end-joining DNA ligase [Saprospiraceae bacterium]|nr:non-homologous end-joining DNA ligase [Saprospiraceae bacterium]